MDRDRRSASVKSRIGWAVAASVSAALLVDASSAMAQTDPVKLLNTPTPAAERIAYGPSALNFGELRVPGGAGPFPVAILIHGGCWQAQLSEDAPAAMASFELLRPAAEALARQGIATWNIEYPRVGDPGGGWPGTYRDISRATDFLQRIAGSHHLDLNRVVVAGHSSGGQLALWLAIRGKLPKSSPIYSRPAVRLKGVIDIDGPPDLRTMWPLQQRMCNAPVLTQFLGGGPQDVPSRYSEGAVTDFIPVGLPQTMLIRDHPPETTAIDRQYAQAAQKAGDRVTVVMQQGPSHFDGLNPDSKDWATVVGSAKAMLGLPPAVDRAARH
jgi:acetyl esterase/lipase